MRSSLPRRSFQLACLQLTPPPPSALHLASFLAFAYHAGFLAAVEDAGLRVGGVMGTSAGALAGALYAAGHSPADVASILSERPPASYLTAHGRAWRGIFRLDAAIERLSQLLPATFEELRCPLAVGVVDAAGLHRTLSSGPLPSAVAASFAIPGLFVPIYVPGLDGGPFADGGVADRVGLAPYRRAVVPTTRRTLVHLIERSSRFSGADDVEEGGVIVVRSPRAAQSLWRLKDFGEQQAAARARAAEALGGAAFAVAR